MAGRRPGRCVLRRGPSRSSRPPRASATSCPGREAAREPSAILPGFGSRPEGRGSRRPVPCGCRGLRGNLDDQPQRHARPADRLARPEHGRGHHRRSGARKHAPRPGNRRVRQPRRLVRRPHDPERDSRLPCSTTPRGSSCGTATFAMSITASPPPATPRGRPRITSSRTI